VSINRHRAGRHSPEFVLLGFLYGAPHHGYNLHKRLTHEFGDIWHASQSQTYNILKRLVEQGYITSTAVEQKKRPPRQELRITSAGSKRFESWLNQPTQNSVHAIRVEFTTRLYFTQFFFPEKIQEMIRLQIEAVYVGVNQLQEDLLNLPVEQAFNRLALDLRINLLRSVISWLEECRQAFEAVKEVGG